MRIPLFKTLAVAGAVGLSSAAAAQVTPTVLFTFEGANGMGDAQGWEPDEAPNPNAANGPSSVGALDDKNVAFEAGQPIKIDAFAGTWLLGAVPNRPIPANAYRGAKYTWDTPQNWTGTPVLRLAASMEARPGDSERHQFRIRVTANDGTTTEKEFIGLRSLGYLKSNDQSMNQGFGAEIGDSFVNEWQVLTFDLSTFAGVGSIKTLEVAGRHVDDGTNGTPDSAMGPWGGPIHLDQVTIEARTPGVANEDAQPGLRSLSNAYPNPSAVGSTLDLAVETPQQVTARVVDVLGRTVQTAFAGAASPGAVLPIRVDASRLSAGTYVVVVEGETFRQSRRLTVTR